MISDPLKLTFGENLNHGIALVEQLKKLPDVEVFVSTKALEVTAGGVLVSNGNGTREIKADSVIYAAGLAPREEEALSLNGCAKEFYQIGDCFEPSNILSATQMAYQIVRDIGSVV